MFLSIVITFLIIAAFLCTLLVALSTEFFTGRVLGGPDAMATATPILAAIFAWIVTLLALWCLTARGVFQWIGLASPVVYALVTLVGIGLAFAMAGAFGAWLERVTMVQPLAAIPGVLLPLMLQGFELIVDGPRRGRAASHGATDRIDSGRGRRGRMGARGVGRRVLWGRHIPLRWWGMSTHVECDLTHLTQSLSAEGASQYAEVP